jgi:predicted DNA-binding transcriptional regulator YafY
LQKRERQKLLVKKVATAPYTYTAESLAADLKTSVKSIYRDLAELAAKNYLIVKDEKNRLFLRSPGWDVAGTIKEATIRQLDILRYVGAWRQGVARSKILERFAQGKGVSEKTIERDLKELVNKQLLRFEKGICFLKADRLMPPLQLSPAEKRLLLEALALQGEMSAWRDEALAISAKLKASLGPESVKKQIVLVQGRRPVEDLRKNYLCRRLEALAAGRKQITILYRRGEEPAQEVQVNPLGIVYYWVLDNWYLVAQESGTGQIKTYLTDRILDLEESRETFTYPEEFDLEEWFRYSWGVYRSGKPVRVLIRFYDYFTTLQRVREELKDRKTCVFREDPTGLIMEDLVDGIMEIAVWLRKSVPEQR